VARLEAFPSKASPGERKQYTEMGWSDFLLVVPSFDKLKILLDMLKPAILAHLGTGKEVEVVVEDGKKTVKIKGYEFKEMMAVFDRAETLRTQPKA
jgi:hypothetical protein